MKRMPPLALVFILAPAAPASALYCGTELVQEGQSKYDVLQSCGQPSYSDSHVEYRPVGFGGAPAPVYGPYPAPELIPVEVDNWIYNFGSTQLMPSLRFENGQLVKIKLLGYGH